MENEPAHSSEDNGSLAGEELYRRIADLAYDWNYWLDPEGNYVYLSPSCERLSGYRREEYLADPGLMERLVHPNDRARVEQHVERVHGTEPTSESTEIDFRITARDGSERWINHRCAAILAADGRYLGRWASNENVSRYKLAEERLLQLNRDLLTVRDCARAVLRATDEQRLLGQICRTICGVGGYRMAWVGMVEHDEAKTIRPVARSGVEDGYLASTNITWADTERGRGPTGTAARTSKSVVLDNYASDESGRPWRERAYQRGYRSSCAIPVLDAGGGAYAVLTVYAEQPYSFTASVVQMLEEVAEDLSFGIRSLRSRATDAPS